VHPLKNKVIDAHLQVGSTSPMEVSMVRPSLPMSLLLAAATLAAANSVFALKDCETNCLGTCVGIDISTAVGGQPNGPCMTKCGGTRSTCLIVAEDKTKAVPPGHDAAMKPGYDLKSSKQVLEPKPSKTGIAAPPASLLEGGGPSESGGNPATLNKAGTIKSQTIAPTSPTGPAMGTR
jgi:hypothetical protein